VIYCSLLLEAADESGFRAFYTCPLGRDDPNRCKFFKWADELQTTPQAGTSRAAQFAAATNQNQAQTLGQIPQDRFSKPTTPTIPRISDQPITPQTGPVEISAEDDEEIDWEKVDTDNLEREAILSTPGSSQPTDKGLGRSGEGTSFTERLRGALEDGIGKRKRNEEADVTTPRRVAASNVEVRSIKTM